MKHLYSRLYYFFELLAVIVLFIVPPIMRGIYGIEAVYPTKPESLSAFLYFLCLVCFSAGFEELLYRLYLPYRLKTLFSSKGSVSFICVEAVPIALFAVAHLQAGWGTVIYAAFAGLLFRSIFCAVQKKYTLAVAMLSLSLIHSIHNLCSYYLFLF